MASLETPPPPSYDAVVADYTPARGITPSAPPLSVIIVDSQPRTHWQARVVPDHTPSHQGGTHQAMLLKATLAQCLEYYVSCSLCSYMHTNVWMPRKFQVPDPELDVEAHLGGQGRHSAVARISRQKRLRCISGSLCSCWVVLVFVFFFLPVAMIISGIFSYSKCTSSEITLYLIGGGILYTVLLMFRAVSSSLTCCRNRGCLKMSQGSSHSASCICVMELIFLVLLLGNLIVLALGTYYVMRDIKNGGVNECKGSIYGATVFFILLQYLLYLLSALFSCLTYGCHKCLSSN